MGRAQGRAWWMPSVMSRTARSLACGEMSGPTAVPSCAPLPTLSDLAFATSASWAARAAGRVGVALGGGRAGVHRWRGRWLLCLAFVSGRPACERPHDPRTQSRRDSMEEDIGIA
jgi:hypothetical protein